MAETNTAILENTQEKEKFLCQVGRHLEDMVQFGSIRFNYCKGKFININIEATLKPEVK